MFNARTGGLMMLTNQHNIQVSYIEGNFQAVCLYCRRALHTFSLNNTLSIWHLLIQGPLLSILPHIWCQILRGEKNSAFLRIMSVEQEFSERKTVAVYFPEHMGQIMEELIHKNSCTPRDHICGHKFSCRKQFLSCIHPPFLMKNSVLVILN